jgi:hypothetical protein
MAMVLEDHDEDRRVRLVPEAHYGQLDYAVYPDAKGIIFTVDQSAERPVIELDGNGEVHALREGSARITAEFEGVQDSIVVTVYRQEDAPTGYSRIPEGR